jgi:Coenzyme PQQ synthesis protein D (PqqD)
MTYRVNSPSVVCETIDGEALIVNLENGNYYSATNTAESVWALVSAGVGVDAAIDALSNRFTGNAEAIDAETRAFVEKLIAAELLISDVTAGNEMPQASLGVEKSPWAAPKLREYTDMQDLIALDPIHDVGDRGWPNTPPAQE